MAKNKIQERVRQYYKGPVRKPTKVADQNEMNIISEALIQCVPERSKSAFKIVWKEKEIQVKLVIGLKATLRHLKRKETIAIVIDETCPARVTNLLIELANKLPVPIIKAQNLLLLAPQLKLNTIQAFCFIDTARLNSEIYNEGDPKPKPVESVLEIDPLNKLVELLQGAPTSLDTDKFKFRDPHLVLVRPTGKSKAKKAARKVAKEAAKKKE